MEILAGLIGLISLIVFFVMAVALNNISKAVRNTNRIISAWSKETGIGLMYSCKKCYKSYEGKQATCPHCGDPKTY